MTILPDCWEYDPVRGTPLGGGAPELTFQNVADVGTPQVGYAGGVVDDPVDVEEEGADRGCLGLGRTLPDTGQLECAAPRPITTGSQSSLSDRCQGPAPQMHTESRTMIRRTGALRALFFLLVLAAPATAQCSDCVFPGAEWEVVGSRELGRFGWDPQSLRAVTEHLRYDSNSTGVVVVDKGRVVFSFGDTEELSYLASVRKSILAMLYGYWVENGTIDLDATLEDLDVDDVGGLLPIERRAKIRHLITARSGVYHAASNGGDDLASAPERGSKEPGSFMLYNNWDFNAAGAVFEQLTGRNIYDEMQAQIAIPIGFQDWDRTVHQKSGDLSISRNPAYHFHLSTRDMARIGHLMLNEGTWDGRKVLPGDWSRQIRTVVTPIEEMNPIARRDRYFGYSHMWWVWDGPKAIGPFAGAYTGRGAVGQWITVFPAIDLVVAHKTNRVYRRTTSWDSWQRMIELLLEARSVEMTGPYPWG